MLMIVTKVWSGARLGPSAGAPLQSGTLHHCTTRTGYNLTIFLNLRARKSDRVRKLQDNLLKTRLNRPAKDFGFLP